MPSGTKPSGLTAFSGAVDTTNDLGLLWDNSASLLKKATMPILRARNATYVRDYCVPDGDGAGGGTDCATALQAAVDAWVTKGYGCLVFDEGVYRCDTGLVKLITGNITKQMTIEGNGAILDATNQAGASVALKLGVNGAGVNWYNLTARDLSVYAGVNAFEFTTADATNQFLYRLGLENLFAIGFSKIGLNITNNTFEASVDRCHLIAVATNVADDCISVLKGSNGIPSSIEINQCNTRYGQRGVYAQDASDVTVSGGTFLFAYEQCILLNNLSSAKIINAHVEDAFYGNATYAADPTIEQAAQIIGNGVISGVYGVTSGEVTSYMKYAVGCAAVVGHKVTFINNIMVGGTKDVAIRGTGGAAYLINNTHTDGSGAAVTITSVP